MLVDQLNLLEAVNIQSHAAGLADLETRDGNYLLRFAQTTEEIDAALKLRFEVFNLELGEGLESSYRTGRDQDEFDQACNHLIVIDGSQGRVVGTYRMQTAEMAADGYGFYSASEFDLSYLPRHVLDESLELGRACIAREHRNTRVLFLLWKGVTAYLLHNRKRYLFGCCSLTSQDERVGSAVTNALEAGGHFHTNLYVAPRAGFECRSETPAPDEVTDASVPKLFRTYLRYGAKVCGPPAIDRQFKTIDFFVIFDLYQMGEQARRAFFPD